MTKPLVSVIIPAYNAEDLILEALMSVKAQTYPDWEIIVVEDASKDRTEQIVQEFAKTVGDRNVKYIRHQNNLGLSETRNTGIKEAQGEYLALLDHDDLWKVIHLETAVSKLESESGDLAYCTVQMFEDYTNKLLSLWGPEQQDIENFPASLFARNYIQPSAVVMRTAITEKVGFFDPNLRKVEDLDYWLRVAVAGFQFVYVPAVNCLYRKKSKSAMTSNISIILEGHALVLRKHRNLSIIPTATRGYVAARYHLGVAKRNFKINPIKAAEFFIWALRISPKGTVEALAAVILESFGVKSDKYSNLPL
ncbi:glycosyltransferase family 2 protein [Argonema antarcticum]|uniref:glycosyltransferase family 2 protein n=1 Tax=Argonema antarcticum TaxID=2942763 RepID=UPI002012E6D8|nr:glycosyltransferase family 2 protein [Argonema antarcticum]MCL1475707.1 glycosyltransferase family 2 protein [Argonema antarcticum A004/B2]